MEVGMKIRADPGTDMVRGIEDNVIAPGTQHGAWPCGEAVEGYGG